MTKLIRRIGCVIHLGTILEVLINIVTLGYGNYIALKISTSLFNREDCGCCERKNRMNLWTCKNAKLENCNQIKLK
jgi:hypothetical protein